MAVSISLSGVWKAAKVATSLAYKAAFLLLAYVFVNGTMNFYAFFVQAAMAFYKQAAHAGI